MNILKESTMFVYDGRSGKVDGKIVATKDIEINGKVVFEKDDTIAIIEVKSTVTGESLESLCGR